MQKIIATDWIFKIPILLTELNIVNIVWHNKIILSTLKIVCKIIDLLEWFLESSLFILTSYKIYIS